MMPTRNLGWLALFVIGLALPFLVRSDYSLTVMSTAFIFALATIGLNLLTGYTGQFNLAHGGFMAVGAYTVGILTVDYQVPFWIAFALAGVVSVVLGFFVGLVSLRLKGNYFAIFTLCVGYIIFLAIEKWDSLTHGVVGIIGIAAPPSIGPISFENPRALYYLTFAFLAAGMWIMHRIVNSLVGHTFVAIRNSEHLAQALGIDLMRNKMLAFLISTFYAGIAGGLYAGFVRFLGPDLANIGHTFDMTMYVVVGGIGTLAGPLLGAIALPWLTQSLQFMQDYRFLVFGPLLIVLLIFLPRGLVGLYQSVRSRLATRDVAPARTRRATSSGDGHA
ncbi:MAG: branched-chain amino acid ABC transporter permease [Paraburkholderia tropica]|uniref:Amino acid/amide ABC transporter membrane protein 2 (HAAT family) n=1 Tax=Paraburkholderia tropica TaxID=92647 RepID=A0ABX5MXH8_9BURK|nr:MULTISPECIES: branched-chain amino acid ABC transporter permease [Burkholderiaceae]MDE1140095.1 branched-chain amino acid ABC transporter permease [Paraburkholderia tropica]PXX18029.1 amino acid/amide ABC transporter membrane protein 2 (HAAT family) [Paraburkholderia tropica]PZW86011.1 amino acid/amide ABC transporter membrane protein 2 (HAAT family) [Paraburkholderia tropica]QNB16753.1 branched-chain amino acid ABC transporter permease [Paraburkholderia tropica]RQM44117.1 branched-chain am